MPHVEKFSFPVGIYKFAHIIRFINMHKIEDIFRKEIHHIIISTLKPDFLYRKRGWSYKSSQEGAFPTQNGSECQQNRFQVSSCHSLELHPMFSLVCRVSSVQPPSAIVHQQSSLYCAPRSQTHYPHHTNMSV